MEQQQHKKKHAGLGHSMLQSKWLVHYVPFALFLGLLAVVYIANGHYADDTIRRTAKARSELKQLQYEYKVLRSELMYRSKESELVRAVAPLGLKRLTEPPIKIETNN
ncbi:MAG TPA: FtsL-like putative cell division protein [Phnomibacter sp.]|nr:FtsL-like putative cell division protein [Phnomibacter sp.]